jgi:transcriptional regulator of NAD metabolism
MPKAEKRRREITTLLMGAEGPLSGSFLAEKTGVSRQIIVQDITVLKAAGYDIISTHKGYIIKSAPTVERVFKVHHDSSRTEEELSAIVSLGGIVVDVYVWHRVYGKIGVGLNIFSELGIKQFMEGIKSGRSTELMHITGGYHYHTVRADSPEVLDRIQQYLCDNHYIVPEI